MVSLCRKRDASWIVVIVLGLVSGCGRNASSPLDEAYDLFSHSQFDAALQACDRILAETKDPQQLADLHLLRGRCYLEQAARLRVGGLDPTPGPLPEAAKARFQQAVDAFGASIAAKDSADARYFRSEAYDTLGNGPAARDDVRVAHDLDNLYQRAWINEPIEQPLAKPSESSQAGQADGKESKPGFGDVASQNLDSETNASEHPSPLTGEDEDDEGGFGTMADSAAPVAVPGRDSPVRPPLPGQTRTKQEPRPNTYVGLPLPPGATTLAGSAAQNDAQGTVSGRREAKANDVSKVKPETGTQRQEPRKAQGQFASRNPEKSQGDKTSADASDEQSSAQGEQQDVPDDSSDESSDAAPTDEEPGENSDTPRRPVLWPPLNGPWSGYPTGPGAMPLPTTGLGAGPVWGGTPPAATGLPQAPTTGVGTAPAWPALGIWPGAAGAAGGVVNPFTPPHATAPGFWPLMPGAGRAALGPRRIGPGATPGPGGPIGWPQSTFGGPVTPTPFSPPLPSPELPTTGVHRSVSPYPQ